MSESPPAGTDPEAGFAGYRVERTADASLWKLGSGAMGVTYKAYDERLRVHVALKVITPVLVEDAKTQALFLREARAAARVRHGNVASVLALNDTPGNFFYAMEFIEGESLQDWLKTRGPLPPAMATGFASQIARGLGAIHEQQIVHRDLKPANLMIVAAGREKSRARSEADPEAWQIKIIDFGLARGITGEGLGTEANAQTTGFRGTALYASPEQCEEHGQIDGRSDLYSLGCILWEMLTGAPPFRARTHRELLNQHVSQAAPLERIAHLPAGLPSVLARLLAKDPASRFGDADALVKELERCRERIVRGGAAGDLEVTTHDAGPDAARAPNAAGRVDDPRSRSPLVAAAFVAAMILLGGALWWLSRGAASAPVAPAVASVASVAAASRKAIAVLPFANLSAEKENEYFADGVQEDVLTNLSRIKDLKVISRTSVMGYRGKSQNVREIARELGVGAVVEGSVRRAGDRIRVSAQLIDANTDERLWAENFDSDMRDIFTIQGRIAQEIARALQVRLSTGEAAGLQASRGENVAAYELYRRGLAAFRNYRNEDNERAIELFRDAIGKDPKYAVAYAALAESYTFKAEKLDASLYWLESAVQAAEYAVAIDPQCAEAYSALGSAYFAKGWYRRANAALTRALELNPNYAVVLGRLALSAQTVGDWDRAWQRARRAVEIDPNDPLNYLRLGDIYFGLGEIDTGERWMRQGMARLDDPAKVQQIEIQIAHAHHDYRRIVELFTARQSTSLNRPAQNFGELPGRGPVGYYAAMASWHLGDFAAMRERLESALRAANPDGLARPALKGGIAIPLRQEGRDTEMREACRESIEYLQRLIDTGSESPRDHFSYALAAWLLDDRPRSDEQIELAMRTGLLVGKTDQPDMLPKTLMENPRFLEAVAEMNRKIETQRARIRELEKQFP